MNKTRFLCLVFPALLVVFPAAVSAQQISFEDVVRNLRNPDPELRISAVRLLRDARYPEAIAPMAALVNDPINDIQLEVISTQLAFFLVEDIPMKRKVAFVVEVRSSSRAPKAFDLGPLAVWPKAAPSELVKSLLNAVDDENSTVRVEAIYAVGIVGGQGIEEDAEQQLIKALDHYDPAIRTGAARVIGRLRVRSAGDALIKAMNDSSPSVRYASMRALGEIAEGRAVQALTEQFNYYAEGEGAWSALDALARIAHPSSVELFKAHLADKDPYLRRAAAEGLGRTGYASATETLQNVATTDHSSMVRAAAAYALRKLGQSTYLDRLIDFSDTEKTLDQVRSYLLEMGPTVRSELRPRLQEPSEKTRRTIVDVLGAVGDTSTIAAISPLLTDRDSDVAQAATHAIERIKMRTQ
jgi:HEAT repeat protein